MSEEIINGKNPNQRLIPVLYIILMIALCEATAQYNLKKGNGKKDKSCVLVGGFFYFIVAFLLYRSYSYEGLGHVNLLWSCMSIIIAFLSGMIFFGEKFNKYTCIAVTLALGAIYVSHLSDEN
jgi:drug/metabolite transporter (DMT)-like permease